MTSQPACSNNKSYPALNRLSSSPSPGKFPSRLAQLRSITIRGVRAYVVCQDGVDEYDLAALWDRWLDTTPDYINAHIAPRGYGDGIVNMLDLAVLADEWQEGL